MNEAQGFDELYDIIAEKGVIADIPSDVLIADIKNLRDTKRTHGNPRVHIAEHSTSFGGKALDLHEKVAELLMWDDLESKLIERMRGIKEADEFMGGAETSALQMEDDLREETKKEGVFSVTDEQFHTIFERARNKGEI